MGGVGVRFAFAVGEPGGEGNFGLDEDEDEDGLLVGVAPLGGVAGGGVAPLEEREEEEEQEEEERRWGFLGGRPGGGADLVEGGGGRSSEAWDKEKFKCFVGNDVYVVLLLLPFFHCCASIPRFRRLTETSSEIRSLPRWSCRRGPAPSGTPAGRCKKKEREIRI